MLADYYTCAECKQLFNRKELTRVNGLDYCPSCKTVGTGATGKPTNPKDALGIKKAPTFYIPTQPVFEEGLVMLTGARKYGPFNWREKGVRFSVYYDAARRHLDAFKEGQDVDPESGLSHLAHARACLGIVMDSIAIGNLVDDRPKPGVLDMALLNEKAKNIVETDRTQPVPGGY